MTENPNPADPARQPGVPAGYDQPAPPSHGQPPHQQPADQGPPAYFGQPPQPYQQPPVYQQPQQPYQQPPVYQQPQQQFQQPGYGLPQGGQKSKVAAGILGILLGSLGIHNFYLGYTKKALIQLLISVISFGALAWAIAIWGLVEGILILVGNDGFRTDARGIPLKD
ncbi:TM2 domain-containing protein [Arthrobacter sp. STN4]|uniref:TM2 domain-containing protein n=1 Tax=Arthrobacter sp. STN4 TaxID=2923276 RepID=UPI00211A2667|nr:TM2 domain-containing protein [Arthrobacter sp. STN4]MCQ9165891.1 TM2 domain-containing protein [Arthrobacter sp. STN4]